jgi:hypothetical protein
LFLPGDVAVEVMRMELVELLQSEAFLDELHRFLWTEPVLNKGARDEGWSCRDHVAVIGQIALDAGAAATVLQGKCMFVQGANARGEPPVGLGQLPEDAGTHSWLYIEDVGHVDVSPRLDRGGEGWRPLHSSGVVASSWAPASNAALVVRTTLPEYEEAIALASRANERSHAIYYIAEAEPFSREIANEGLSWANSPRTDELRALALPDDAYVHLARHLVAVADGTHPSVGDQPPQQAWAEVLARGA